MKETLGGNEPKAHFDIKSVLGRTSYTSLK